MCSGTVVSPISAYAVTNTKPVNPDGTKPNYNKPQDMASDDQRQYADQAVRLLVSKIKTAQGAHEGIAPKTTDAKQEDTITYKISGRVEGTIQYLEEKYGTGNVEFAYDSAGHYLGYGWMKGTYEYLLNRKKAAFPEDLNFDIIYDGGVFSGYAYVTRKLATAEDANRFVAGANMALYQAIEITRDNTITNDGKDVGEDHRFNGVEVTRNSDSRRTARIRSPLTVTDMSLIRIMIRRTRSTTFQTAHGSQRRLKEKTPLFSITISITSM